MIYFVQCGAEGPVKIGYVEGELRANVLARIAWLQVANYEELRLLAVAPGGLLAERALHQQFASGRIRGEWFAADTAGLWDTIAKAVEQADVVAWQLRDDGLQLCEWCGEGVVEPPRRSLCSERCARAKRVAAAGARR